MLSITQFPPPPADQSWYYWFYQAGLRGVPFEEILAFANSCHKQIRGKDLDNYNRGTNKNKDPFYIDSGSSADRLLTAQLSDYPSFPAGYREPIDYWIPCNKDCKPLVKWSQIRCTESQALAYRHCEILGKNLKGLHTVVIDVDGDHDGIPDHAVINYWSRFINYTSSRVKYLDGEPVSFHLEFYSDKLIPTLHFPKVDLLGNRNNQVQYLKPNKIHNHLPMAPMDDYVWQELKTYVRRSEYPGLVPGNA